MYEQGIGVGKDEKQAVRWYGESAAQGNAAAQFNLGVLYDDNLSERDKAKTHYKRFLELAPDDVDAPNVIEWLRALE